MENSRNLEVLNILHTTFKLYNWQNAFSRGGGGALLFLFPGFQKTFPITRLNQGEETVGSSLISPINAGFRHLRTQPKDD